MTQNGIAVLRYDDRGVGESSGEYIDAVEEDFIMDARAAFDYLATRQEIASNRVGLLGFSEGSLIAAQVASYNP